MEEKVYETFDKLGIKYEKVSHPALYTCADNDKYNLSFNGTVCKNLFIRNKKKTKYYLVSTAIDKKIDLKSLQAKLDEKGISFASEQELADKLNIKPGSVSVLNLINAGATGVVFIVDKVLLTCEKVGFHPNVNTATVLFAPQDIEKIFNYYKVDYDFLDV